MKRILLIAGFLTIMLQATDFACNISLPVDYEDEKGGWYSYRTSKYERGIGLEFNLTETYRFNGFLRTEKTRRFIQILRTHQDDRVFFEIKPVKSRELLTFKCEEKK